MSTRPAVTMQDLELEQAELLPSRETRWVCHPKSGSSSSSSAFIQNGYGNTAQSGRWTSPSPTAASTTSSASARATPACSWLA